MTKSNTILFVHGYMQNALAWTEWKKYFQQLGFTCHSPSWIFQEGNPKELRENPNDKLKKITLKDVLDEYEKYIDNLPEKPILIGYSLGGLIVQKLISNGKGVAGVCIHTGPPKGVIILNLDFLISNFYIINPFKGYSLCLLGAKWYNKYVCNDLTYDQTVEYLDEFGVPSSRNIPRTVSKYGDIDFSKPHKPLLFLAGSADKSQPAKLNFKNFNAYTDTTSLKEYKQFPNRTHHVLRQQNWQEVAQYSADWILKLKS